MLAYSGNMGQAQIRQLFTSVGVRVSAGYLAGLLTDTADFAPEAQAVGVAGLAQDGYAHIDVTPTRVAGSGRVLASRTARRRHAHASGGERAGVPRAG